MSTKYSDRTIPPSEYFVLIRTLPSEVLNLFDTEPYTLRYEFKRYAKILQVPCILKRILQ